MENLYRLEEIKHSYSFNNGFSARAVVYADYARNKFRLLLKCISISSPAFTSVRKAEFEGSFPRESVWVQMMQKVENKYGLDATALVRETFEAVFSSPDGERHIVLVSKDAVSGLAQMSCSAEDGERVYIKVKVNMRDFDEIVCVCRSWLREVRGR